MPLTSRSIYAVFLTLMLTRALAGQTIRGQLVDEATGLPISGGFVVLLSDSAVERGRALTDREGRFNLVAPTAGRYTLKSAVIGIRSVSSEPIDLAVGEVLDFRFGIPAVVVILPAVVIEEERTCRGRPQAGLAAATLWEEAQKALDAVVWTEQQAMLRHLLMRYESLLVPGTLEIEDSLMWSQTGFYQGSPFRTQPAEQLAEAGYIQKAGREYYYYGPDANVLLSDAFAGHHCFEVLQSDRRSRGLVGLAFEPIPGRKVPDVEGVLWLDAETAELRHLEYRYTRVPFGIESEQIGGRVEFERLPIGPWIVRRWWIRMPLVGVRPKGFSDFVRENYLAAIKETGGWVSEIHTLDGEPVKRGRGANLRGMVLNLTTAAPLVGARVILVGTDYEARTDDQGRFRFDNLAEGTYRMSFAPETLSYLGFVPPLQEVTLTLDQSVTVGLVIPARRSLWSLLCPASNPADDGVGIVSGFVRDASSHKSLEGVQVVVSVSTADAPANRLDRRVSLRLEEATDWAGYYRVCNIPGDATINVEARLTGWSGTATSTRLSAGDIIRMDFELTEIKR